MQTTEAPWRPGLVAGRKAISGNYTVLVTDLGTLLEYTGVQTISLPAAATAGAGFFVNLYMVGGSSATIDPSGAETIVFPGGTDTTYKANGGQSVLLSCNGTGWEIIGGASFAITSRYRSITGNTTLTANDGGSFVECGAVLTVTVPTALATLNSWSVYLFNSSSGNVTVSATGGSLLVGPSGAGTSISLRPFEAVWILNSGGTSTFFVLATTTPSGRRVVTLSDAATIATDASLGDIFEVTITANRTLGAPTNPTSGQKAIWRIKQDGVGGWTLAYNAVFRFSTSVPSPTLSTAINTMDMMGAIYNSGATKWDVCAVSQGYA